jgi:hypothetical protein
MLLLLLLLVMNDDPMLQACGRHSCGCLFYVIVIMIPGVYEPLLLALSSS